MKLSVNGKECIGCKMCVRKLPEIFFINKNKEADVKVQPQEVTQELRIVVEACPEHAILLEE